MKIVSQDEFTDMYLKS